MRARNDLVPPHDDHFLSVQHHLKPVAMVVGVVHGSLVDVAFHRPVMAGVLAGGDRHPVAVAAHPRLHAPNVIGLI